MSSEEKTEKATPHKLREARKRGEAAVSKDLSSAVVFAAVLGLLWFGSGASQRHLQRMLLAALDVVSSGGHGPQMAAALEQMLEAALHVIVPYLLLAALVSIVIGVVQTRGVFSTEPIKIKFDRLNPAESLKQLFSTRQLGVLVQMLLKLALLGVVLVWTVQSFLGPMVQALHGSAADGWSVGDSALRILFAGAAAVFLFLGLVDFLHQHFEYLKRNRMSKTERKQERKNTDGSPEVKAEQRARRRELMSAPVPMGVAGASVVVTNPTHFAVALYYEPGVVDLPVVVAKGHDAQAMAIRADAGRHDVPIMENPPLARALFSSIELGERIGDEHIDAVAEVFRWVQRFKAARHAPH
ncbi:EscU/YscU/HrcU family type III secretion system export apparatus switch protein [Piscinibacter terrae]|uniref:Flagellar type III secretion system protein FlhB n=1 Tax=Piscinibacter terrae TaxID=2496871 RepID=A0A3N7JIN8_9BURK|nr:EscU/YscU/HrcU family type III secretion system export apparatus switch protein [Albitalea terrae]RQP21309.1 flagellar type III secretion system protein FlhB [Albitalea terrae]